MSVIAACLNLDDTPAEPAVIERMMQALKSRAPEGSGSFTTGPVALGHGLMSITPESVLETSPWRSRDGTRVITFDGRLDHRDDLCAALGLPATERGVPDPELILRAVEKWGADGVARLEGDFSFALWDDRQRQLWCARSAMGDREFFYHLTARRLVLASTIRGVLAAPGVPRELNEIMLGCHLGGVPKPADQTLYAGIRRLPGGRLMIVRPGGAPDIRTFWQVVREPALRLSTPQEYAEALRELIERAVRSALRTRHPAAAMLSGGLDSSGVACLAARECAARSARLATVSNVLPVDFQGQEWAGEEGDYIRAALAMYPNLDPHWSYGRRFPVLDFDEAQFRHRDVPIGDPFSYRSAELFHLAESSGARVVLGGIGGDMAASYAGGGYLEQLARTGQWVSLRRNLRLEARARAVDEAALFRNAVLRPLLPQVLTRAWDRLRQRPVARDGFLPIHPELAARIGLDERWRAAGRDRDPAPDSRPLQARAANAGDMGGDNWAIQHAPRLEAPQPLLDRRVWEWCHRVPVGEFVRDGVPRGLFRQALHEVLPEQILRRTTKGPFAPDFRPRLAACVPAMTTFLHEHPANDPVWHYVNRQAVAETLRQFTSPASHAMPHARCQITLIRGFRLAHFVGWFRRSAP